MNDEVVAILRLLTNETWYDESFYCMFCMGEPDWDAASAAMRESNDIEHDDHPQIHRPTCLWVRAHRPIGRDLGFHSVKDMP